MDACQRGLLLYKLADLIERDRIYIAVSKGYIVALTCFIEFIKRVGEKRYNARVTKTLYLSTTSGLTSLMHGVISLLEATSYDKDHILQLKRN